MTANLQRALRLLEDGYPRVQGAGTSAPQDKGLWSFPATTAVASAMSVAVTAAAAAAAQMG
jgi:hypothetical protein